MRMLHRKVERRNLMKFSSLNPDCKARLSAKLSASGKRNGFQKGDKHPNWKGGIRRSDGYTSVLIDGKYIKIARLIMAKDIGRHLKSNEISHHINSIRDDDRIENLMLFNSNGRHTKHHHRLRRLSKLEKA